MQRSGCAFHVEPASVGVCRKLDRTGPHGRRRTYLEMMQAADCIAIVAVQIRIIVIMLSR